MAARTRPGRATRFATGVLLLGTLAGCGSGRAGVAVPDGDEAAAYVSAKFSGTLENLSTEFNGAEARRSTLDRFGRFDAKRTDSTVTAIQVGTPPGRVAKNHSNRDSTEYLDSFHPADSPVEYLLLGPVYASLAPTPWVSMPYDDTDSVRDGCFWAGYQDVCKMLSAVDTSVEKDKAAKQARRAADGSVELTADVSVRAFLDERVIVFPPVVRSQITDEMLTGVVPTRVVLDPRGKLRQIEMNGTIRAGGHELELRMNYRVLDPPTTNDLPKVPDPKQVTVLADKKDVDDFYQRLGALQGR